MARRVDDLLQELQDHQILQDHLRTLQYHLRTLEEGQELLHEGLLRPENLRFLAVLRGAGQ